MLGLLGFKPVLLSLLVLSVPYLSYAGIDEYKAKLREIAPAYLDKMRDEKWKELTPLISQEVLDDAHSKSDEIKNIFKAHGLDLISRKAKSMERIKIKKNGTQPDIEYKVNSDFSAFRIHVEPTAIKETVDTILDITHRNEGYAFIRNSVVKDGKLDDIVQYVFIYLPSIGYVTELQVGHPFASYTFTMDSLIRDRKNEHKSFDDLVDLWSYPEGTSWKNCFYMKMKDKILNPQSNFDVKEGLAEIFGSRPADPILLNILAKYL